MMVPDQLWRNPGRNWVVLFLLFQCSAQIDGFVNAYSRWATMVAMKEDGSFRIDQYRRHTIDWAQTPDGHTYSNKAPGPMLLGYPIFWLMDEVVTAGTATRDERDDRRVAARPHVLHWLSVLTQAVPYAIVTLLLLAVMRNLALPAAGIHLAAVALLFGQTASLLMNTYFGHAMAAVFVLATLLSLHRRWPARTGLFFGLGALCDYGALLLAAPVLVLVTTRFRPLTVRNVGWLLLGGLAPAVAWIAYHQSCFGSPFALPQKFQNPVFVDVAGERDNLWGVFRALPSFGVALKLLFSRERGLAFAAPWALVCVGALLLRPWRPSSGLATTESQRDFARTVALFGGVGLLLFLGMNASFGGWHGGATPGPRYLSPILPVLAALIPIVCLSSVRSWCAVFILTVGIAVALFALVFATEQVLVPVQSLFRYYVSQIGERPGPRLVRLVLILAGFTWVGRAAVSQVMRGAQGQARPPQAPN